MKALFWRMNTIKFFDILQEILVMKYVYVLTRLIAYPKLSYHTLEEIFEKELDKTYALNSTNI